MEKEVCGLVFDVRDISPQISGDKHKLVISTCCFPICSLQISVPRSPSQTEVEPRCQSGLICRRHTYRMRWVT